MEYLQYTKYCRYEENCCVVLNLIINGIPSIPLIIASITSILSVLNLIINGIPSIREGCTSENKIVKWVLNLIINGIPSILRRK